MDDAKHKAIAIVIVTTNDASTVEAVDNASLAVVMVDSVVLDIGVDCDSTVDGTVVVAFDCIAVVVVVVVVVATVRVCLVDGAVVNMRGHNRVSQQPNEFGTRCDSVQFEKQFLSAYSE